MVIVLPCSSGLFSRTICSCSNTGTTGGVNKGISSTRWTGSGELGSDGVGSGKLGSGEVSDGEISGDVADDVVPTHPFLRCRNSSLHDLKRTSQMRHIRFARVNTSFRASSLAALTHVLLFSCAAFASVERKLLPHPSLQWPEWKSEASRTMYAPLVPADRADDDERDEATETSLSESIT